MNFKNYRKRICTNSLNELSLAVPQEFKHFVEFFSEQVKKNDININEIKNQQIEIEISSEIWPGSGLGSSASTSVSFIKCLKKAFKLNMTPKQMIEKSYQMEKHIHGTPSGIDNTICVKNTPIWFREGKTKILKKAKTFPILIIYTGKPHNTKRALESVKKRREKDTENVNKIIEKIGLLTEKGRKYFEQGDLPRLGDLMDKNHKLLRDLGVSSNKIEKIINISTNHQIWGIKLTGAGKGGCLVAIGKIANLKKLKKDLETRNIRCFLSDPQKKPMEK